MWSEWLIGVECRVWLSVGGEEGGKKVGDVVEDVVGLVVLAQLSTKLSGESSKLSVVTLNSRTPRIEPWGTPPLTDLGELQQFPTRTDIFLPLRKVVTSPMISREAPCLAKDLRHS